MDYYNCTICMNGHVLSSYSANLQKYCSFCGKETISNCPNCDTPIHGSVKSFVVGELDYIKPFYCGSCGHPYPWTEKILESAIELVSLDEELDKTSRALIKNAIPDLLVDVPSTPLAAAKYKKECRRPVKYSRTLCVNFLLMSSAKRPKNFISLIFRSTYSSYLLVLSHFCNNHRERIPLLTDSL